VRVGGVHQFGSAPQVLHSASTPLGSQNKVDFFTCSNAQILLCLRTKNSEQFATSFRFCTLHSQSINLLLFFILYRDSFKIQFHGCRTFKALMNRRNG
jgi:hypothetical protein